MATTPRILIVDDFSETAALLGHLLSRLAGFETRTATDGFQAIRVAEEFRPEFVFLDIGMPNLNGFETAKRIRKQPWSKGVILIAMSAHWDEQDQRWAEKAGFDGYLLKPMPIKALVDLIEKFSHADRPPSSRTRRHLQRPLVDPHSKCL
jgi:CheY-like chemotaxis protein